MTAPILTALITALGGIMIAGATYWFTKQRERDAELRTVKLEHYKEFVASLSGIISGESTAESQRSFARASNNLMLIAPQAVIEALQLFQQEIRVSNTNKSDERHDQLLSKLIYEMRSDLHVLPADNANTFQVGMWASGFKPNTPSPANRG